MEFYLWSNISLTIAIYCEDIENWDYALFFVVGIKGSLPKSF